MDSPDKKLWGGRFTKSTDRLANHFHSSISFDARLYEQDIRGSIAHARMLGRQGIIREDEAERIVAGLEEIRRDIEAGKITFDESAEDIHMNIETLLISRIGEAGKRLHTGRSRNDQVALDMRMYVKSQIEEIRGLLKELLSVLVKLAREHVETVMPGYTHMQKAQPVTLGHHLLAYFEMFRRDFGRLGDCYVRTDCMPLGAGALAATTYPLDRDFVKNQLGFSELCRNSLDAVSDRDFCVEYLSALCLIMAHLSRFCEELVLWSTDEFQFVELDDAYSTGSSIMPQKKNPDMAELIRGKTGRVYGDLVSLLTTLKGLPLAYNKDLQEDKEPVFDATDTVKMCLPVFSGMLSTMAVNRESMRRGADRGFTNATDAADFLVARGAPFRDAHKVVGELVLYCVQNGKTLGELSLEEYRAASPLFTEEIYDAVSVESCLNRRNIPGGPAPERQLEAIRACEAFLAGAPASCAHRDPESGGEQS